MRSFDPDNTVYQGGSYTTVNTIDQTFEAGDDSMMVSATSTGFLFLWCSPAQIFFFASGDSRAEVYTGGFTTVL